MALRVLLADESSTIKKVIQLALQDYGVQVKTVNVGVDALEVARTFHPDIVFADILLQKKSGYDVCQEIKKDQGLRKTPVILMWSGFLELDEAQFSSSHADDQLEKPFHVETLRNLIKKWVPKLETQAITDFIEFPRSVRELKVEADAPPANVTQAPTPTPPAPKVVDLPPLPEPTVSKPVQPATPPQAPAESGWSMDSFEDIQKFAEEEEMAKPQRLEIVRENEADLEFAEVSSVSVFSGFNQDKFDEDEVPVLIEDQLNDPVDTDEPWLTQDLSKFKLDIPDEADDVIPVQQFEQVKRAQTPEPPPPPLRTEEPRVATPPPPPPARVEETIPRLSSEELERIVRAQSKDIIEAMVRKIVPDIATQLVRDELNRLLREEESL